MLFPMLYEKSKGLQKEGNLSKFLHLLSARTMIPNWVSLYIQNLILVIKIYLPLNEQDNYGGNDIF